MKNNGRVVEFGKELLLRPIAVTWGVCLGIIAILTWIGIGEYWKDHVKFLVLMVISMVVFLVYLVIGCYKFHTQIHRPLRVREVLLGEHYNSGTLVVILERSNLVLLGDILTLYVCRGSVEDPICLLEVDTFTTDKRFIQSTVVKPLTDVPLSEYLTDKSRLLHLVARFGVKISHLKPES